MHTQSSASETGKGRVFDGVTPYHWLVVIIASCGWLFDCMDQRLFILARESALRELLAGDPQAAQSIKTLSGYATTSMILGWATGGIIFGMMSDRLGRVKTMMVTLVIYSGFTGLSGLAHSWVDFTIYRFLVGLGVGGMFGAATTLVAESVPGGISRHGAGLAPGAVGPREHHRLAYEPCHSAWSSRRLRVLQRLAGALLRRHRALPAHRADHLRAQGARGVAAREGRGGFERGSPDRASALRSNCSVTPGGARTPS